MKGILRWRYVDCGGVAPLEGAFVGLHGHT